jgi:hypothetical protein
MKIICRRHPTQKGLYLFVDEDQRGNKSLFSSNEGHMLKESYTMSR